MMVYLQSAKTEASGMSNPGVVVHVLVLGQPLCRFADSRPADWPDGHMWVSHRAPALYAATCDKCCKAGSIAANVDAWKRARSGR